MKETLERIIIDGYASFSAKVESAINLTKQYGAEYYSLIMNNVNIYGDWPEVGSYNCQLLLSTNGKIREVGLLRDIDYVHNFFKDISSSANAETEIDNMIRKRMQRYANLKLEINRNNFQIVEYANALVLEAKHIQYTLEIGIDKMIRDMCTKNLDAYLKDEETAYNTEYDFLKKIGYSTEKEVILYFVLNEIKHLNYRTEDPKRINPKNKRILKLDHKTLTWKGSAYPEDK